MKTALRISIGLNLCLVGGLIYFVAIQRTTKTDITTDTNTATASSEPEAAPASSANATAVNGVPRPFRWSQLVCTNDYRQFVANLRAIGCPETTIRDIVAGDAGQAFAFKRAQLKLDGSGSGPWSNAHEAQLVATLLGEQPVGADALALTLNVGNDGNREQSKNDSAMEIPQAGTGIQSEQPRRRVATFATPATPVYPLAFRQVDLASLGFGAAEKAAIDRVRQEFVNEIGGVGQDPDDPAYLARWQKAQANADDALRGALGSQAFLAFQFQQYYEWYQPQVTAAETSGRNFTLNPELFSKEK